MSGFVLGGNAAMSAPARFGFAKPWFKRTFHSSWPSSLTLCATRFGRDRIGFLIDPIRGIQSASYWTGSIDRFTATAALQT